MIIENIVVLDKDDVIVRGQKKEEIKVSSTMQIKDIPLSLIERSEFNVRKLRIEDDIYSLAKSMDDPEIGLSEPIKVRKKGGKYHVYDGQRRVLAARMLGWEKIPGIIISDDKKEEDDLIRSLIHDTEHVSIEPQDKVDVIDKLLKDCGGDYRIVAKKLHKSVEIIRKWYSWKAVPEEIKKMVGKDVERESRIYKGVAKQLSLSIAPEEEKLKIGKKLTKMNVADREQAIDIIREDPEINAEELEKKIEEVPISVHISFNNKLSNALRKMAHKYSNYNYGQLVGDIVVDTLVNNGFVDTNLGTIDRTEKDKDRTEKVIDSTEKVESGRQY